MKSETTARRQYQNRFRLFAIEEIVYLSVNDGLD